MTGISGLKIWMMFPVLLFPLLSYAGVINGVDIVNEGEEIALIDKNDPTSGNINEKIYIAPLFEYPSAPDELSGLNMRTNWLMEHFWDNMDFKRKTPTDQNAVYDAFDVYVTAMPYAERSVVLESIDRLLKNLSKNPALMIQFTKAAEDCLYGQRAKIWIDEAYIRFLKAFVSNKKIDRNRKIKYADQLRRLEVSQPGSFMPELKLTSRSGEVSAYKPTADFNIIEFGMPDCDDCRRSQILLEVDMALNEAIDNGKASMTFVITDNDEDGNLMDMTNHYSGRWQVCKNGDVEEILDLRRTPSIYIVDRDGRILDKNVLLPELLSKIKQLQ